MKSGKKYLFWGLFAVMAVYYGYRLFALTPWYDELYTYYYFISKGPVYAAIHWPLPNNHVGYSVLSGFLNMLGNPYIGLRGVSYLCALANLYLLYQIAAERFDEWLSFAVVILYVSMELVNQLAVQGRGYTLGITCFLFAWRCLLRICGQKKTAVSYEIAYSLALTLGLYAVPSNVYWVVPLCLSGGFYLLMAGLRERQNEKCPLQKTASVRKLFRLVWASLAAALATLLLYVTIWGAIGSNLLVKEENGTYYGMGHVQMLCKAPFAAIARGMKYMLDTPYIQSESRDGFAGRLWDWLLTLSGYYYRSLAPVILAVWIGGLLFLLLRMIKGIRQGLASGMLTGFILFFEILFVPVCLLIQCKRPYYRVFTYGGVLLALLLGILLDSGRKRIQAHKWKYGCVAMLFLSVLWGIKWIGFSGYNNPYGQNEYEIQDAFAHADFTQGESYCVTDCNQEYLLCFLYGIRCENRQIEGSDVVLLDKRMTDPDFDEMVWEFYHDYDSIPWDYIEENMTLTYENENYVLYTKTEKEREK